jgi:hypothetical protein|tara:strand:- start:449 stop:706 length:258 start_codon:yes stop_codon:yes gene_type:complete
MKPKITPIEEKKSYKFALTKDEVHFLRNKFQNQGFTYGETVDKIDIVKAHLRKLVLKLKEKKHPDKTIHEKFLEEFARLMERENA